MKGRWLKKRFCKHHEIRPLILDHDDLYFLQTKGIQSHYQCKDCGKVITREELEKLKRAIPQKNTE